MPRILHTVSHAGLGIGRPVVTTQGESINPSLNLRYVSFYYVPLLPVPAGAHESLSRPLASF
jgi:hypothetical protein